MVRVDIYIGILSHSRAEGKTAYYYCLQCLGQKGKPYRKESSGVYPMTTRNRAFLMAMVEALKRVRMNPSIEVVIHGNSDYVKRMLKDIEKYQKNEWKNSNGNEIKNVDLWRLIYMQTQIHWMDIKVEQIGMDSYLQEVYERNGH